MKLTGNQIMYLLTIKKISMNKHVIRSVDVASQMDYSRASIHKMLGTLKKMGLIEQEYYSSIKLTSLGSRVANGYLKKYDLLAQTLKPVVRLPEGYNLGICNLIELM
ncbi:MAG: winged helix DNA-binding protein [Erysipelotrichaceae bacterium]|nr:winged helix DNA-binding protein [Erysipelotrichaceae bacterium]MBR3005404.1 winged helix DNA-binding protein [Erysipelotrichaceae bacterium]MBR6233765.1 winged helix DNA-binding protein [Erysipelotrichaceae bacterium]